MIGRMIGRNPGKRGRWFAAIGAIVVAGLAAIPAMTEATQLRYAPVQSFDTTAAAPRQVEETTALAVQRDYAHAWLSLVSALEGNRADLLNENFTGVAREQWQDAIRTQRQNGLSRHIVDHGHALRVTFYSLDGSAMEANDTADLEVEYREGDKVLNSERVRAHYLILLTPTEDSWKIRVLQELPPG